MIYKRTLDGNIHWHLIGQDFLSGLDREERDKFYSNCSRHNLKRNQQIFSENDEAKSCYYIESGVMQMHRNTSDGRRLILFVRGQGDIFGLAELLNRGHHRHSASAMTTATLYELPKAGFEKLLMDSPTLTRRMMEVMGRRIRFLNEQVQDFMHRGVSERLLKLFVCLSYEQILQALPQNRPVPLPLRITQEEMASMIGSCQQTVSAALRAIQDKGLIAVEKREITLLNSRAILTTLGLNS